MVRSIKRKIFNTAIVLLVVGLAAAGAYVAYHVRNPAYVIAGRFYDVDSGKPIENIVIKVNGTEIKSDKEGQYSIGELDKNTMIEVVTPQEYLPVDNNVAYNVATSTGWRSKEINKNYYLAITDGEKQIRLQKDINEIYNAYKLGTWDIAFDAMHPDSQQRFKKDDYVALNKKNFEGITITNYKIGTVKFLDTWKDEKTGKQYTNVAEADVSITGQIGDVSQTVNQPAHFAKVDDKWRWFSTL